jgi:hypothetical protein
MNPNEPRIKNMLQKSHKSEFLISHLAFLYVHCLDSQKKIISSITGH